MGRNSLAIVAIAVVLGICIGIQAARLFAADGNEGRVEVARQQMALAGKALQLQTNLENQGRIDFSLSNVPRWSRRLVEATRNSGASKSDVADAMKQHLLRMEERVQRIQKLVPTGSASDIDVWNAKYEVLDARMWLYEGQAN